MDGVEPSNVRPPEVRVLLVRGILGLKPQYEPVDRVRVGVSIGGKAHKHACAHVGASLTYRTEVRLRFVEVGSEGSE